ncbi:MAG: EamA family transporter [Desulfurococcales archaeon]|nr:EamA family transporter [Desulfurococcales archaeon]
MLYSALCLIAWGLWGLVLKYAYTGSSWVQVYFASSLASFLIALAVFASSGASLTLNKSMGFALVAGVFGGVGYIFFIKALHGGKASIVIPLTALYPAITAVLAMLVLGERISLAKGLGIILALVAAVLLSM